MVNLTFNLFFMFYSVQIISSSRILGVFPTPSISHQVVFRALTLELAKRGHELTVITPDPVGNPPENLHQIDVHNVSYDIWKKSVNFANFGVNEKSSSDFFKEVGQVLITVFSAQLNDSNVKKIIQGGSEFDLILIESVINFAYGFAHVLRAPYIGISSMPAMTQSYENVGSPTHPVLYPSFLTRRLTDLTLFDKINNVIADVLTNAYIYYYYNDMTSKKMKNWFGNDCPSPSEIEKNVDLLITNNYPIISGIRSLVPAVVTAGGIHIKLRKPLPKDLQYYLDNSTQGVIYFSLGTNVLSKDLPKDVVKVFLDVFSKLPYNILWKFEDNTLAEIPDNVRIMKWLPQNDLLGHPNIKLFISQGGQQSLEEAIQSGVPLLMIPFMADQSYNAERVKILNIGLRIDLKELTRLDLNEKIEMIIKEPRFKNNVTKLRDVINDEPESGLERAVWWIEYVIRHKGAKHLRSPAADVTWTNFFMVDVIAICLLIACISVSIVMVLAKTAVKSVQFFWQIKKNNTNCDRYKMKKNE